MIVSVLGRQRVILEDGCYHKDVWQGIVESSLLGLYAPPAFMLVGMCVTWLHSRWNERE